MISINDPHIMCPESSPVIQSGIIGHNLHIRLSIPIFIIPVNDQVMATSIASIFIPVNHQAITIHITFQVAFLHIIIIINPLYRSVMQG